VTWTVEFRAEARSQLLALDPKVQDRIVRALDRLAVAPRSAANVTAMVGGGRYRLRVGDWR
jgi:mRNA-degrading endonuclease RelE of RelBE toxin-antitoxin system